MLDGEVEPLFWCKKRWVHLVLLGFLPLSLPWLLKLRREHWAVFEQPGRKYRMSILVSHDL